MCILRKAVPARPCRTLPPPAPFAAGPFVASSSGRVEETLADRRSFHLDAERWEAFQAALDAPPRDLPRLKKILNEPSVFSGREPA
ncbi:type II toxin-antitoxin system TacA family antitoxin [Aquibium oceanicum]|uniref:type II toxin-antitoxin system TacA family antitoxin n=1 Tax=Aquibium oceanicum TaxID=1670800 RepID=UPI0009FB7565|nr:DUF1778 domain-containing protein [Aquibium oceanicum]